jgi:hypothetical protein
VSDTQTELCIVFVYTYSLSYTATATTTTTIFTVVNQQECLSRSPFRSKNASSLQVLRHGKWRMQVDLEQVRFVMFGTWTDFIHWKFEKYSKSLT